MRLLQLIELYFYVCEIYEEELQWHCMRLTKNNARPVFTDEELLTSYLFSVAFERKLRVKDIHKYIHNHWLGCFPALPSYAAYNARLNRLAPVFPILVQYLIDQCSLGADNELVISLTDSVSIITCSGKDKVKSLGNCVTKAITPLRKCTSSGLSCTVLVLLVQGLYLTLSSFK